jgi:hypothetical protein
MSRFHRAIQILLYSQQPESDEVANQVLSDGSDQGVDFFLVSEDDDPVVSVVQVKDHQNLDKQSQKDAVLKMVEEIRFLQTKQRVDASWDERRQERFRLIGEAKEKDRYTINFVLLLTGGATPKVDLGDFSPEKFDRETESLTVVGVDELVQLEIENLEPRRPDVSLLINVEKSFMLKSGDEVSAVVTYMKASDYVEATRPHGTRIFRLNPRLFLGKTSKTNKKILETLATESGREAFHFFNNGITAVCEELKVSDGASVEAKDFQVVNGCQSTETLWEFSKSHLTDLSDVLVPLRIINTGGDTLLAEKISEHTNTQTAIASSDLIARTPLQERLRVELGALPKPVFYETRRGAWNAIRPVERERYRVAHGEWSSKTVKNIRHVKLKELAQAMLAVTRSPNAAKEQISSLFSNTGDGSVYRKVMELSWTDIRQVQLVTELFKFCSNKDNWLPELEDAQKKEFAAMAGLGRFYVMHLVYSQWARTSGHSLDPDSPSLIDGDTSGILLSDFKTSVGKFAEVGVKSLLRVKADKNVDTRQLLRNSQHRAAIEAKFRDYIDLL